MVRLIIDKSIIICKIDRLKHNFEGYMILRRKWEALAFNEINYETRTIILAIRVNIWETYPSTILDFLNRCKFVIEFIKITVEL